MLREAALAITAAAQADDATYGHVIRLLMAAGRLPANSDEVFRARYYSRLVGTLGRFAELLPRVIEVALAHAIENDDERLSAIRDFFLEPQATYSIEELATLWRLPPDEVQEFWADRFAEEDELAEATGGAPHPRSIEGPDAVETSNIFYTFRAVDIERALGADLKRVRPESWRTVPLLIHIPRFIADVLEPFAPAGMPAQLALAAQVEQVLLECVPRLYSLPPGVNKWSGPCD